MQRALLELTVASAVITVAAVAYPAIAGAGARAGDPIPHGFAVAGTLLMLWAQFGHSLRRRVHGRGLVPARVSLSAHVIAGLVGPILVLLHAAAHFHRLAGTVMVMTLLVVASGLAGRLLYPAVEHRPSARKVVAAWHIVHVSLATAAVTLAAVHVAAALYFSAGVR